METSLSLTEIVNCGNRPGGWKNLVLEASRYPTESVERVGGLGLLLLSLASNRYWIFRSKEDYIELSFDVKSASGVAAPPRARLLDLLLGLRFGAPGSYNLSLSFGLCATAFSSSASCRSSSSSYP